MRQWIMIASTFSLEFSSLLAEIADKINPMTNDKRVTPVKCVDGFLAKGLSGLLRVALYARASVCPCWDSRLAEKIAQILVARCTSDHAMIDTSYSRVFRTYLV